MDWTKNFRCQGVTRKMILCMGFYFIQYFLSASELFLSSELVRRYGGPGDFNQKEYCFTDWPSYYYFI